MIPLWIMSKLGTYKIEMNGAEFKATVIEHSSVVDAYISEFRSLVKRNVVAFDVKYSKSKAVSGSSKPTPVLLLLCVGTRCLIFKLSHPFNIPESLKKFLDDESICFVGTQMSGKLSNISAMCKTLVELGELAARVMQMPELQKLGLRELASTVGVTVEQPQQPRDQPDWNSKVFSAKEVKDTIHEAYTCYAMADKLVSSLK